MPALPIFPDKAYAPPWRAFCKYSSLRAPDPLECRRRSKFHPRAERTRQRASRSFDPCGRHGHGLGNMDGFALSDVAMPGVQPGVGTATRLVRKGMEYSSLLRVFLVLSALILPTATIYGQPACRPFPETGYQ